MKNPIMLLAHDARQPIGRWTRVEQRRDGLFVGGIIGHGFEPADTARKQVQQKILRALSIGFRESARGTVDASGVYHIDQPIELLEISLVAIPANQEAVFTFDADRLVGVTPLESRGLSLADRQVLRDAHHAARGVLGGLLSDVARSEIAMARRRLVQRRASDDAMIERLQRQVAGLRRAVAGGSR